MENFPEPDRSLNQSFVLEFSLPWILFIPIVQGWGILFLPRAIWIFIASVTGHTKLPV